MLVRRSGAEKMADKIWTVKEVLDLQNNHPEEYQQHRMEILSQMSQGLVK